MIEIKTGIYNRLNGNCYFLEGHSPESLLFIDNEGDPVWINRTDIEAGLSDYTYGLMDDFLDCMWLTRDEIRVMIKDWIATEQPTWRGQPITPERDEAIAKQIDELIAE